MAAAPTKDKRDRKRKLVRGMKKDGQRAPKAVVIHAAAARWEGFLPGLTTSSCARAAACYS